MKISELPKYFQEAVRQTNPFSIEASFSAPGKNVGCGLFTIDIPNPETELVYCAFGPSDGWTVDTACEGMLHLYEPSQDFPCKLTLSEHSRKHYHIHF